MRRDFIKVPLKFVNLCISYELCNQPEYSLDIFDILILDYIHRLPMYCKPYTEATEDNPYYCNDGKFNYSEAHYVEFCELYNCLDSTIISFDEFYNRIDNLVNIGLMREYSDDIHEPLCYRTTALYDEYIK